MKNLFHLLLSPNALLFRSIQKKDLTGAQIALDKGAHVNEFGKDERTPIMELVRKGALEKSWSEKESQLLNLLLKSGASPSLCNLKGQNALSWLVYFSNTNYLVSEYGSTALSYERGNSNGSLVWGSFKWGISRHISKASYPDSVEVAAGSIVCNVPALKEVLGLNVPLKWPSIIASLSNQEIKNKVEEDYVNPTISFAQASTLIRLDNWERLHEVKDLQLTQAPNFLSEPFLFTAALSQNQEAFKWLLENGADPLEKNQRGENLRDLLSKENQEWTDAILFSFSLQSALPISKSIKPQSQRL